MLIDFEVKNFRSFKNSTLFTLETGARLRKYNETHSLKANDVQLLKSAVVFGANAHGKSNLFKALGELVLLVGFPTKMSTDKLYTDTFAGNNENTYFKVNFIKNNQKFSYTIEYNAKAVVFEQLIVDDVVILERETQSFKVIPAQIKDLKDNIRENQLFLYFAQLNNVKIATTAVEWLLNDLIFVSSGTLDSQNNWLIDQLKNDTFKTRFLLFLKAADFNIVDIEVIDTRTHISQANLSIVDGKVSGNFDEKRVMNVQKLITTHSFENGELYKTELSNESQGTQAFLTIALYILFAQEKGNKVIFIDEFTNSFHLELAQAILDLIHSENQKNQFILTTHELSLMDYELRADQIYFAQKDRNGATDIFSLFDFDDKGLKRNDFGYKKRYLNGMYGAKSAISSTLLKGYLEEL